MPAMNSERARRRRQSIIAAAMELFAQTGWPVATTDEIAAQAGVTKRTLYTYFGSKQSLLREVGDEMIETSRARARMLAPLDDPPLERLRTIIAAYIELVSDWQTHYRVFLEEMKHLDDSQLANVRNISAEWVSIVRSAIEDGQRSGDLDPGRDATVAAHTVLALLNGTTYWVRQDGRSSRAALVDHTLALVLNGLALDEAVK